MSRKRFASENVDTAIQQVDSANTKCVVKFGANVLEDFLREKQVEFFTASDNDKDNILADFIVNVRTKDGEQYKKSSLSALKYGIWKYLSGKNIDINDRVKFPKFTKATTASFKMAKNEGKGEVVHKPPISKEDMQKLYQSGVFKKTPQGLLNKAMFEFLLYFCNRGQENLREFKKSDIEFKADAQGKEYAIVRRKATKNHPGRLIKLFFENHLC